MDEAAVMEAAALNARIVAALLLQTMSLRDAGTEGTQGRSRQTVPIPSKSIITGMCVIHAGSMLRMDITPKLVTLIGASQTTT